MGANVSVPGMSNSQSTPKKIEFKVTLVTNGQEDVKSFQFDDSILRSKNYKGSFDELVNKLSTLFPQLESSYNEPKLTWTDQANDIITINNDDDLLFALEHMKDLKIFKVHLTNEGKKPRKDNNDNLPKGCLRLQHSFNIGGVCNNCKNNNIVHFRYKCLQCQDYTLCAQCYKNVHVEHVMMSISLDVPNLQNIRSPCKDQKEEQLK